MTKNTKHPWAEVNDRIFAGIFIMNRIILAPITTLYLFEGDNVLFTCKMGYVLVIFISWIWGSTIFYNIALAVKGAFETKETKDKGQVPWIVMAFHDATNAIEHGNIVRKIFIAICLFLTVLLPFGYYGFVRGNLFRNF